MIELYGVCLEDTKLNLLNLIFYFYVSGSHLEFALFGSTHLYDKILRLITTFKRKAMSGRASCHPLGAKL